MARNSGNTCGVESNFVQPLLDFLDDFGVDGLTDDAQSFQKKIFCPKLHTLDLSGSVDWVLFTLSIVVSSARPPPPIKARQLIWNGPLPQERAAGGGGVMAFEACWPALSFLCVCVVLVGLGSDTVMRSVSLPGEFIQSSALLGVQSESDPSSCPDAHSSLFSAGNP